MVFYTLNHLHFCTLNRKHFIPSSHVTVIGIVPFGFKLLAQCILLLAVYVIEVRRDTYLDVTHLDQEQHQRGTYHLYPALYSDV